MGNLLNILGPIYSGAPTGRMSVCVGVFALFYENVCRCQFEYLTTNTWKPNQNWNQNVEVYIIQIKI